MNFSNKSHDTTTVYTTDGRIVKQMVEPNQGSVVNPLDKIKGKDKSRYIVHYGNVSFSANDDISIDKMTRAGRIPDCVESVDGNECYCLRGTM